MKSRIFAAFAAAAALLLGIGGATAQTQVALSPLPVMQFTDNNGVPLAGGEVFTYAAGTTTKINTYTDSTGATPNTNPIILDSRGDANIWLAAGVGYKIVLAPAGSSDPPTNPIWTVDNILNTSVTQVTSNTILAATPIRSFPGGVWRTDYADGNGAPPEFFKPETGTCAANSRVNDGGSCVDVSADGNSWVGTFPGSLADIREFGAIANNATDASPAINAAVAYSIPVNACVFVPSLASPFAVASMLNIGGTPGACLTGPWGPGHSGTPSAGCMLHFNADTSGISATSGRSAISVKHLSICGNAAQSTVSTQTAGLVFGNLGELQVEDVNIQDFVTCVQFTGPTGRNSVNNINCADQALYPNLVNGFPQACAQSITGSAGAFAATNLDGWMCREQSFGGVPARYNGDGSTKNFDIAAPSGGIGSLFAADGIKARVGLNTTMPNGFGVENAPQYACGPDYTLWDISGTPLQVYCARKTITITPNSNVATVTVGGVSDIPAIVSPNNIAVIADHGLALDPRITSVNTGSGTFTMTGPATVVANETINVELVQIGLKNDGCSATVCAANMEVRFVTAPGAGSDNVVLYWQDPTGWAAFDMENSSDYIEAKPIHVGGYRELLRWVGQSDGGINFKPSYIEFTNQIADIEALSSGIEVNVHNTINFQIPGAYAADQAAATPVNTQSQGGMVAPWYVSPIAGPTKISYANRTFDYNGASSGGEPHPGYVTQPWHLTQKVTQTTDATGVALGATDTIYCSPDERGTVSQLNMLALDNVSGGSGGHINMAVYANDPVTARPGQLLTSTGSVALSAPSFPDGSVGTNVILSPGFYWDCMMGSWSGTAPSFVSYVSSSASLGGVISPFNWWMTGASSLSIALTPNQAQGVTYAAAGLFAAGFPQSLTGLTSDAPNVQMPVWWSREQ